MADRIRSLLVGAVFLAVVLTTTKGDAQGVLAPPPSNLSGLPPGMQTTGTNQPGVLLQAAPPTATNTELALLEWGPVQFHPHFLYRLLYGDGIPAQPGQDYKTFINQIYPGVLFQLGNHWALDYTPIFSFYSDNHFRDTWDNTVTLVGGTTFEDWTLGFSQGYISSSEPLIETGGQTDTATHSTALNAVFQASSVASIELAANQTLLFYGQGPTSEPLNDQGLWSTRDWFNYQVDPKLTLGLGVGFGYDKLKLSPDMTHEELQGRVNWRPGPKLTVLVSAGAEYRQFLSSDVSASLNPIFGASALYQVFEPTTLSLTASRSFSPAGFVGQLADSTTLMASVRQRLLTKLFLDASGGYFTTSYSATEAGLAVSRNDHGTFLNLRLSLQVLKRGTAAVFYHRSENSSDQAIFTYSSSQVGFELGYRF